MTPSKIGHMRSFSTRIKSVKRVSLHSMNQNVRWLCMHPPEYVFASSDIFRWGLTRVPRCKSMSSYSTKSSSHYGDRESQSNSFDSIIPGCLLSMHASFMEGKRYYLWTRTLKRGFSL